MTDDDTMSQSGDEQHQHSDTANWESKLPVAMESDEAQQQYHGPPPHIAARFYRNSLTRRKSSAASSRRNSLSSAHSHTSSRSRRGSTGQSTYVAQHLRRASIIESRKARLADRAAHAEQVRLRAALAKATPRGSNANSEERALAAQVAKEKYLAKVAAACAEEVARAKRIAEEVKERKLADETRQRLEMEERHAEAEKRRQEYQRNLQARRQRRAESAEKKLAVLEVIDDIDEEAVAEDDIDELQGLTETAAARRVQKAWRLYQRKKPVAAFRALDLTAKRSPETSFEDMTALVADPDVISSTTAILTHIGLQEANDANAALNTRTFLSAYMIIGHPLSVLVKKDGTQEQDLIWKATEFISQFETAVERLDGWNSWTVNPMQLENLSQSYTAYTSAFAAWRLQDSSVLIEGMVASFVELDAIWQTVKDDSRGEVASDYREGIRDNQVLLLSRIRKLAGPDRADFLIKKAIRESRRRKPKRRPAAEVRPRGLETSSSQHGEGSDKTVEEAALATSPVGSGEINKLFTAMPSNRVLTHELAIDKDYKLEDKNGEMRDLLYRTICDSMKAGFEAGNGSPWTVSAAENVREKLLRMLKPGNNMHTMISDALDLENIARQCQQGVFSYSGFFNFMAQVLPKLCAPFRDQEVKALAEELRAENGDELDAMIEKLFKLLRTVDVLSLDYTNFMIMNAAPTLIKEAAGYESRQFAKDLEAGNTGLDQTRRWWLDAQTTLNDEADRRDPEGVRNPADRPSPANIYTHALVETAIWNGDLDPDTIPETLQLDVERLQKIRTKAIRVAVIGAILLTTKNLLKRDVRSQWKNEASRLWQLLSTEPYEREDDEEPTTAQKAFSILETAHNMPPSTKQAVSSTISRFFAQAADTRCGIKFTDPVLKVLFQRLKSHILSRLNAESSAERVRAASSASDKLAASGMAEFTTHVAGMVDLLDRIRKVDMEAHGRWYSQIVQSLGQATTES